MIEPIMNQWNEVEAEMETYQVIYRSFAGANIFALFTGLVLGGNTEFNLNMVLIILLMISLRIKFWFDDEAYFKDVKKGNHPGGFLFQLGFASGILSWIVWMFASLFIRQFEIASLFMSIFFIPTTIWIIISMIEKGGYDEQISWLIFNFIYMLGFMFLYIVGISKKPFAEYTYLFSTIMLITLLCVFLYDLKETRRKYKKRQEAYKEM